MRRVLFLFGAGASYGAGDVLPGPPPLGGQLFGQLAEHFPGSWGSLPPEVAGAFGEFGFEEGMGEVYEKYTGAVPRLLGQMALYLIQYRPASGQTLYGQLFDALKDASLLSDSAFATLNYDCLIEFELLRRGLTPNCLPGQEPHGEIDVWKLHGSCNWFSQNLKAGEGIQYGKGIVWEGGVEASFDIGQVAETCLVNQGLAPVMSLYMEGKPLQVSPSVVEELQAQWAQAAAEAEVVVCVGVRPWPDDDHIWDPLAQTPAELLFIGDLEEYHAWRADHRSGPSMHLGKYFHTGYGPLLERLRGIMKLTEQDKEKFVQWVNEKCGGLKCVCCGHGNWAVGDACNLVLGYNIHTTRFHYHEGMPILTLICSNCGHIVPFNPGVIGFQPDVPDAHAGSEIEGEGAVESDDGPNGS